MKHTNAYHPFIFLSFSLSFSFSDIVGEWENWLLLHITRYYTLRITLLLNDIYEYNHCKPKKFFFISDWYILLGKKANYDNRRGQKYFLWMESKPLGGGFPSPFFIKRGETLGGISPPKKGGTLGGPLK